jgi:hypothetical protein
MVVLTASAEGKLFNDRSPSSARMIFFGSARTDGVRLEACTRRVTGFELAVEDNGVIGEFLSWQAELGAKEDLGLPAPGQSHEAHAFFEVTAPRRGMRPSIQSTRVCCFCRQTWLPTCCLICADVQHQGEADLFPGKGGELWASLW